MKKDNQTKARKEVNPNLATGASSAVGAMGGMAAGTLVSDELHAEELPEEEPLAEEQAPAAAPHAQTGSHPVSVSGVETKPEPASEPDPEPAPEPDPVEPANEPEIVVEGFETSVLEDGSQVDVAYLRIDGQEALLADFDQDGQADFLAADMDGDGWFSEDEIFDVEGHGISMEPFSQPAGETLLASVDGDYVNDANVDNYMA